MRHPLDLLRVIRQRINRNQVVIIWFNASSLKVDRHFKAWSYTVKLSLKLLLVDHPLLITVAEPSEAPGALEVMKYS